MARHIKLRYRGKGTEGLNTRVGFEELRLLEHLSKLVHQLAQTSHMAPIDHLAMRKFLDSTYRSVKEIQNEPPSPKPRSLATGQEAGCIQLT